MFRIISNNNLVFNPELIIENGIYYIIPNNSTNSLLANYPNTWFDHVKYKGAFGHYNWTNSWTLLSQEGYIK